MKTVVDRQATKIICNSTLREKYPTSNTKQMTLISEREQSGTIKRHFNDHEKVIKILKFTTSIDQQSPMIRLANQ